MLKIQEEGRVSMDAVRMEESAFLIAEDYMKQVIRLGRGILYLGEEVASRMTNKTVQLTGQLSLLGTL